MIARTLGESGFGEYSFLLAYVSIALVVSTFGMDIYVMRVVSNKDDNSISTAVIGSLVIQIILAIMMIFGTIIWSVFSGSEIQSMEVLLLFLLILIPSAFGTIFNGILKGMEKMGYFVIYLLVDLTIQAICIHFFLTETSNISSLILILLIARLAAVFIAGLFVWLKTSINWQFIIPSWSQFKNILRAGSYISMAIILATIIQRLGVLTLSYFNTDADVGVFNVANKLIQGLKILPAVFYGALFPSMVKGGKQFQLKYKGIKYLFIAMGVVTIIGYFSSDFIIAFLFEGFEKSDALFKILIIGIIPFMLRQFYAFRFLASGKEKEVFIVNLISLCIALVTYNISLYHFGLAGLCWAINLVLVIDVFVYVSLKNFLRIKLI